VTETRRRKGIPLYYQVMQSLKEDMLSGRLSPEERLPSEADLTEIFQVSRVVVRQALDILENEGLIIRIRGKGTFVARNESDDEAPVLSGYIEDFLRVGGALKVHVLEFKLAKATPEVAGVFKVAEGSDIFHSKRLRLVGNRPFSIVENFLPYHIGRHLPVALLEREPLMTLIETELGVSVEWASQIFSAVSAGQDLAALLEVDPIAPILKMTLTAFTDADEVVNYAHVYYRPDRYNHHGYLRRRRVSDHLTWTAVEGIQGPAES
jgi:GntR family transcriptional regulator